MVDISSFLSEQVQFFLSPLGIFVFVFIYIFWIIFLLPGSWLSMVSGAIYGTFMGSLLVFISASIGAIITFFLGRTFLRNWTQRRLSNYPKLSYIEKKVSNEGLRLIVLTRLSPLFPFGLLNLVFGLSQIYFKDFVIGLFAILPGTILYCTLGSLAGELSRFHEVLDSKSDLSSFLFSIISSLATLLIVILLFRSIKNALKEFESSI